MQKVSKSSNKFHTSCRVDYSFNKVKPSFVSQYLLKIMQYMKKLILLVKVAYYTKFQEHSSL